MLDKSGITQKLNFKYQANAAKHLVESTKKQLT